jgi:hypothetical protein
MDLLSESPFPALHAWWRPPDTALSCKRRIDEAREARIEPPLVSCSALLCARSCTSVSRHDDALILADEVSERIGEVHRAPDARLAPNALVALPTWT